MREKYEKALSAPMNWRVVPPLKILNVGLLEFPQGFGDPQDAPRANGARGPHLHNILSTAAKSSPVHFPR